MLATWLAALLLLLAPSFAPALADNGVFLKNSKYNSGDYGRYITQSFKTSPITPPRFNFMKPFSNCDDGSYLFIAPRGEAVEPSFFIMDHEYVGSKSSRGKSDG